MKGRGKPLAVAIGVVALIAIALVIAVQPQRLRPGAPLRGNLPAANDVAPAPPPRRAVGAPSAPGEATSSPRSPEAPLDLPPGHPPISTAAEPIALSVQ